MKIEPIIRTYREFIQLKIGSKSYIPINEYLIRRILRWGSIPSINSVVDIAHIVTIKTLIPIAVFDYDRIKTPLLLRLSIPDEEFTDVKGRVRRLEGNELVLIDSNSSILYLCPSRISYYAVPTHSTRKLLVLAFGIPQIPKSLVLNALKTFRQYISMYYPRCRCSSIHT